MTHEPRSRQKTKHREAGSSGHGFSRAEQRQEECGALAPEGPSGPRPRSNAPSPSAPSSRGSQGEPRDAAGSSSGSSHFISQTAIPSDFVIATIDGAARGNPGPAAYGAVFEDAKGAVKARLSSKLGKATNNVAEYRALLAALAYAREQGWRALKVRTDSELLARQLQGRYKVKSLDLKPLHEEAQQLISALEYFTVEAVPRKLTRAADKLANAALDGRPIFAKATAGKLVPGGRRPARKKLSPAAPAAGSGGKRTIRAIYQDGVLKPLESFDLPEGVELEITLRIKRS